MLFPKCGESSIPKKVVRVHRAGALNTEPLRLHHTSLSSWMPAHLQSSSVLHSRITELSRMSFLRRAPSAALLSSLRTSPSRLCLRSVVSRQIRYESTEPPPQKRPELDGRSFKGQLYESVSTRLQKERLDKDRWNQQRNEAGGGRNFAITFGIVQSVLPTAMCLLDAVC